MPTSEDESNDNSLDGGMDSEGGRPSEHDEMSLGGGGTYAGGQRSRSGMSIGDEGTLGNERGGDGVPELDFAECSTSCMNMRRAAHFVMHACR